MKKIIAISLGLMMAASGMAQPAITYAKHGLQAGDAHRTRRVTTVEPGVNGANVTWDFSACEVTGNVQTEALEASSGRIAVRNDGNVLFQFDVTPYGNDYYGYGANGYNVVYENPVLKTRYPFGFLDQHSGEFTGYIAHEGGSKTPVEGTYSSEVDGYGTLKLPNGVTLNNVLRVKTTEVQKRLAGSAYDLAEEKYLWYSQDFRYPVFVTIHLSSGGGANGAANVSKSSYVSVAALSAPPAPASNAGSDGLLAPAPDVEHSIYPNPVADVANITYKLPSDAKVSIAVYTTTSVCMRKIVTNELQAAGEYSYSYTPSVAGTYFVRFALGDKTYTEQIVKK